MWMILGSIYTSRNSFLMAIQLTLVETIRPISIYIVEIIQLTPESLYLRLFAPYTVICITELSFNLIFRFNTSRNFIHFDKRILEVSTLFLLNIPQFK